MRALYKGILILTFSTCFYCNTKSQDSLRWTLTNDGGIEWKVKENDSHMDHIEMSGAYISTIIHYGVQNGKLKQKVHLVFPMLRTIPNDTHASLAYEIDNENLDQIKINGKTVDEYPNRFYHKGILSYELKTTGGIKIKHQIFPSTNQPLLIDRIKIANTTNKTVRIDLPKIELSHVTDAEKGAYGASRFALAYGDEKTARELWPLIEWCLEYCKRKVNSEGVVSSDSDELEGRFPAGKANLNTSSLYFDALISAALLGKELSIEPTILDNFILQSEVLEKAIEIYFGRNVSGFETYRYYEGNDTLRAWICTPLTVGLFKRSKGTINALFSDKLWTVDGLASESGSTTFWDRATLYALRGVFSAGETKRAMDSFLKYSKRRLLGEHVPYPVKA